LEVKGEGRVIVGTTHGSAYLDGALYLNGTPSDAQLAFRPIYALERLILGIALEIGGWVKWLSIGILLFLLPGWALLSLIWPRSSPLTGPEKLALACGLSLAFYPILFLWTDLFNVHLGYWYAWMPVLVSLIIVLWKNRPGKLRQGTGSWSGWRHSEAFWPNLTLLLIASFILGTRFYVIRALDVPLWGDSYHHTMIAQLLVDHQGLFRSWQPYADLTSFTYHFGFHSAVAAFHWVSGLNLPRATLWTGQILNGMAVLSIYPLAVRLGGNRWAGVGAVIVAGLLSPMPMFYVNWGRYTQLAGQAILPVVVFFVWTFFEKRTLNWKLLILICLSLGGLALTHYRILMVALLFLVPIVFFSPWKGQARFNILSFLAIGSGTAILFLPWLVNIIPGKIMAVFARQWTTPAAQVSVWTREYNAIGDLTLYLPAWLWLVLFLSIGWGLWRREKGTALIGGWWFLVLLAANPHWLFLPGQGSLSNFAVFIAAYIPAGILIGAALGWLLGKAAATGKGGQILLAMVFIVGLGLWGSRYRIADLQVASHALVTRPDLRAFEWIRQNCPPQSKFLVNSFFAYGDTVVVGSDGGWWIPLVAKRETTLPPINYGSEEGGVKNYREYVNGLWTEIGRNGLTDGSLMPLLRKRKITHVYLGQQQGGVNYTGPLTIDPQTLLQSPFFRPIYHQDRVWIFEVVL
jgi:hypothetical protein